MKRILNTKGKIKINYNGNLISRECDNLESELKKVRTNRCPSKVKEIRDENFSKLSNILDMGFIYNGVPFSPLLKNLVHGRTEDLGVAPLKEEQALFNDVFMYLVQYYNVDTSKDMLEVMKNEAERDFLSISKAEAFYELNQLFSSFGHTTYPDVGGDRVKRLKIYKDRKRGFRPDSKSFELSFNLLLTFGSTPIVISKQIKESFAEAFAGKGPKNSGDPYFSKDSSKIGSKTVKESVRDLSYDVMRTMNGSSKGVYDCDDASKICSIYATLFGRNQTKGVVTKFNPTSGTFDIVRYESAGRVIYGVDRLTNNILSLLYHPLSLHLQKLPEFIAMTNTDSVSRDILSTYKLDRLYNIRRANKDISKYDTSISSRLMTVIALLDMFAFCVNDASRKIVYLALAAEALKPIFYKEKSHAAVDVLRTYGGHKSGIRMTYDGGTRINLICSIAILLEIDKRYLDLILDYRSKGVSFVKAAGDDLSIGFIEPEHSVKFDKLMYERYGWEMNAAKDAPGSAFLQIYANSIGKTSYPLARALRAVFYPENKTTQPWAMFVMTCGQQIEYLKDSPHLQFFVQTILKYDDARLGTVNPETGESLSLKQFMHIFKKQSKDGAEKGNKHSLDRNDPRYSLMFDDVGNVKSDGINKIWSIISKYASSKN